ncbi:MAG: dicarboxylate/amino acid:cation symporter [Pseudomonadales bacterium]
MRVVVCYDPASLVVDQKVVDEKVIFKNITFQVFLAALVGVGSALIFADESWLVFPAPAAYEFITLLKTFFLAALKMLIAPMIFFSLIGGIISIGNVVRLRRLGGVTVLYYLGTTSIAIMLALVAVFLIHPWTNYPPAPELAQGPGPASMINPGDDSIVRVITQLLGMAFTNPFTALVELNILGIVTNAILIGMAIVLALPEDSPIYTVIEHVNKVIFRVLHWVIRILPIGIFAILFDFTLRLNVGDGQSESVLTQLLQFGLVVVGMTLVHGLLVLPLIAWVLGGRSPIALFTQISRPLIVAFSTSSSAATLPVSMQACEDDLKVSNSVASFVLPLGATMNMDGTALFEAIAAIFLAYLFGVELTTVATITVFLMAMVASIGAPGMPSASMAGMQMVLLAVGIPLEAIAILLVIERPLDTIRTAVNVEGDLVGALVVERFTRSPAQE